jgi:hypothetical protein
MALDPHSIGVWSFSISGAFERFHLTCITLGIFAQRQQSASDLWGVLSPFSFLYPLSRCREPGQKLPFLDRDCWIPILSTASVAQSKEGCLASYFISFVPSTHPQTHLSWPCSAETLPEHVLQNKNLRIITKPSTQSGLRASRALITYTASSAFSLIRLIRYHPPLHTDWTL